jgi:LDH2 family malate/lactate/ureidoglycolate dehydrogenase
VPLQPGDSTASALGNRRVSAAAVGRAELEEWARQALRAAGASEPAAGATARVLVDANRRGLDSHGVVFLSFFLPRLRAGTTRGAAEPEVAADLPALALVDGNDALGPYVASFAMELCCDKAETSGAAVVAVRRSSHFGAASCYAELAARRGCAGIAVSNSDPGMGPPGALGPVLGTNPLAIAAPAAPGMPMPSLDFASSVVAQARIILAGLAGQKIPADWAIGPDGLPTDDPERALAGSVLPMAGHKGFALAFMIDVLSGCLPGALTSPEIVGDPDAPEPQGTGHFFAAVSIDALRARGEYEQSLTQLVRAVHDAPRADWSEPFLIPGEREHRAAAERAEAIPLSKPALELLRSLGEDYGVGFPE